MNDSPHPSPGSQHDPDWNTPSWLNDPADDQPSASLGHGSSSAPDFTGSQQRFGVEQAGSAGQGHPQQNHPEQPQSYPAPSYAAPSYAAPSYAVQSTAAQTWEQQPYPVQPYAQQPHSTQSYGQPGYLQQPYSQQPYAQQGYAATGATTTRSRYFVPILIGVLVMTVAVAFSMFVVFGSVIPKGQTTTTNAGGGAAKAVVGKQIPRTAAGFELSGTETVFAQDGDYTYRGDSGHVLVRLDSDGGSYTRSVKRLQDRITVGSAACGTLSGSLNYCFVRNADNTYFRFFTSSLKADEIATVANAVYDQIP